jgi:ABC-type polysaccharide transport system permease subunit
MHFTGSDETYDSTWFAYENMEFLVDRDKPRETLSTVSMNSHIIFLPYNTPFILAVLCNLIPDFLGIC